MAGGWSALETPGAERLYSELIQAAPDAILVIEAGARHYLLANAAAERLLGYTRAELLQMSPADLLDPAGLARLPAVWRQFEQAGSWRGEWRLRRKDGTLVTVEATNTAHEVGGRVLYQGSFRDITERKHAEEILARREAQLAEAQRLARVGSWEFDIASAELWWSDELYRILALTPGSQPISAQTFLERVHPDDVERVGAFVAAARRDREPFEFEARILREDGAERCVHCRGTLVRDATGRPVRLMGTLHDITERKRAEEALHERERVLSTLMGNLPGMAYRCGNDPAWTMEFVSQGCTALTGYDPAALVGNQTISYGQLIHPDDRAPVWDAVQAALGEQRSFELTYRIRTADGEERWVSEQGTGVFSSDGELQALEGFITDITERRRLEEQLTHQAHYDAVTGLANRTLFMERLTRVLAWRRRRTGVAVLFVDLDGFKVINDSLGHGAGDTLLGAVGGRLAGCLRAGDTPARFGGDEFTVLLEDVPDASAAVHTAERMIDALRQPFTLGRREVFMMASIGIAHRMPGSEPARPEDLVREADTALYQAKAVGKGCAAVFDPSMNARVLERLDLETDLQRAVERGELRLHYEPEVDLASGRIVGVEALVRWQHPRRGLLDPADFISIAEETGLVVPIGRWVLAEACSQARAWQAQHPSDPPLVIGVNLSAREFQQPDLVERVAAVLRESGLAEGSLRLEITERVIMDDPPASETVLEALRALGVRLALDDFGAGYSSLSYLRRFPVDTLKIDRAFVTPLADSTQALTIVRAAVALGHALEMAVTAEGIETAEQLACAHTAGCDRGQGYFFTRAVPSEVMGTLIASGLPYPADSGPEQRNRPA